MALAVCENCAAEDEELTPVWPGSEQSVETPQLWCPECLDRYPHDPADDDEEDVSS